MDEKEIMHQLLTLFYIFQKRNKKAHSGMKFRDLMILHSILQCQRRGTPVKMNDISGHFKVTPAAVSQVIKTFEEKGWVERVIPANDRRTTYLHATSEAQLQMSRCYQQVQRNLHSFLLSLGEEDANALVRILDKAVAYYQEQDSNVESKRGETAC